MSKKREQIERLYEHLGFRLRLDLDKDVSVFSWPSMVWREPYISLPEKIDSLAEYLGVHFTRDKGVRAVKGKPKV